MSYLSKHFDSKLKSKAKDIWLGVDVGGTKVATLLVDNKLRILGQDKRQIDLSSPPATIKSIVQSVQDTLTIANIALPQVTAIGLGVPGRVNPQTGHVNFAVNLNWQDLPAGSLLVEALQRPCYLENDVNAAALGVYYFKTKKTVQNMAYVNVGTGIAAGFILNGQLYRGTTGMAGEIGHMVMEPDGPYCNCGNYGCFESLAAGPAIARYGQQAVATGVETQLSHYKVITAQQIYDAAHVGDEIAMAIAQKVGRYVGRGLQGLMMAFDIEKIILGGGVARAGMAFLQPILYEWKRQQTHSSLATEMLQPEKLELLPSNHNAGTWGAVAVAMEQQTRLSISA